MHLSRREVIKYIKDFLNDEGGDWDWDDFISIQLDTPNLEAVRIMCATLPDRYPPDRSGRYCSDAGLEALRAVASQLEELELSPKESADQ